MNPNQTEPGATILRPLPPALKKLVKKVVAQKNHLEKPHSRAQYFKLAVGAAAPEPAKLKVAIVGAGIAGLYAACILQELGIEYTLYEASDRVGGRIKTHYFAQPVLNNTHNGTTNNNSNSANGANGNSTDAQPGTTRTASEAGFLDGPAVKKPKLSHEAVPTAQPISTSYAELGAMRLPLVENHWRVFDLINRVGLSSSLIKFKMSADANNSFVYVNKKAFLKSDERSGDVKELNFPDNITNLWNEYHSLKPDGKKLSADDIVTKIIQPFIDELSAGDPTSDDIQSEKLLAQDYHSLESYLRENLQRAFFIPKDKIEPLGLLSFLDIMASSTGLLELSLSEFVIDAWQFSAGPEWRTIAGGMSRLVEGTNGKLQKKAEMRHQVTKVTVNEATHKVQLTYRKDGSTDQLQSGDFDHVIMTVPLPVLRHIQFTSPNKSDVLGYEKREAVRDFGYDHSCKIFLRFNKRWWEKAPFNIFGGTSTTDLPNRVVVYPSYGDDLTGGVLLASYTWGTDAVRWAGLSETDRLQLALDNVIEMHTALAVQHASDPAQVAHIGQEIRNSFVDGESICWTNEPHSLGAFSYLYPSQFGRMQQVVNEPVAGMVHFAGEHADIYHAWIAASLNSAYRAVKQIVASNEQLSQQLSAKWGKKTQLKSFMAPPVVHAASGTAKKKAAVRAEVTTPKISLQSFSRYG